MSQGFQHGEKEQTIMQEEEEVLEGVGGGMRRGMKVGVSGIGVPDALRNGF